MQFIDRHTDALAVQWRITVSFSISLVTYIATPAFLNSGWHKVQYTLRRVMMTDDFSALARRVS
jgi:hypothetical protein